MPARAGPKFIDVMLREKKEGAPEKATDLFVEALFPMSVRKQVCCVGPHANRLSGKCVVWVSKVTYCCCETRGAGELNTLTKQTAGR